MLLLGNKTQQHGLTDLITPVLILFIVNADSLPAETPGKPMNTGEGSLSFLQWIFPTQVKPWSPALQEDSLPTELSGKLKGNKTQQHGPTDLFTPVLILFIVSERASQVVLVVKNLPAKAGDVKIHRFDSWVGKIPWRRVWQPNPVFLPGESQGQRSLAGYGPQCCTELDTTKATAHTHTQSMRGSHTLSPSH